MPLSKREASAVFYNQHEAIKKISLTMPRNNVIAMIVSQRMRQEHVSSAQSTASTT